MRRCSPDRTRAEVRKFDDGSPPTDTPEVAFASQPLRILLIANDDDQALLIRGVLARSTTPRFQVEHASNGWAAQRRAASGAYASLVLDASLSDTDGETLLRRLRAIGMDAPALLLTSNTWDPVAAGGDDYLPKVEGLNGNALVRAIVGMVQRHDLTQELATTRDR